MQGNDNEKKKKKVRTMQQIHVLTCSVRRIKNQALYLKELQKGEWEGDDTALNRSITRGID